MSTKYQDIDGSLKSSFKLSPTGVELISDYINYETSVGVEKVKRLYLKKGDGQDRVLTEYDMNIPNGAIATFSESPDGKSIIFHLHNGAVLSIPKDISNYDADKAVINETNSSVNNNLAVFDGTSGRKIKDEGYAVKKDLIVEDDEGNRSINTYTEGDIPNVESIMKLYGESVYLLWLRRSGLIGKIPTTEEGWAALEEQLQNNSFLSGNSNSE